LAEEKQRKAEEQRAEEEAKRREIEKAPPEPAPPKPAEPKPTGPPAPTVGVSAEAFKENTAWLQKLYQLWA
jgi:hypothetical protein